MQMRTHLPLKRLCTPGAGICKSELSGAEAKLRQRLYKLHGEADQIEGEVVCTPCVLCKVLCHCFWLDGQQQLRLRLAPQLCKGHGCPLPAYPALPHAHCLAPFPAPLRSCRQVGPPHRSGSGGFLQGPRAVSTATPLPIGLHDRQRRGCATAGPQFAAGGRAWGRPSCRKACTPSLCTINSTRRPDNAQPTSIQPNAGSAPLLHCRGRRAGARRQAGGNARGWVPPGRRLGENEPCQYMIARAAAATTLSTVVAAVLSFATAYFSLTAILGAKFWLL